MNEFQPYLSGLVLYFRLKGVDLKTLCWENLNVGFNQKPFTTKIAFTYIVQSSYTYQTNSFLSFSVPSSQIL